MLGRVTVSCIMPWRSSFPCHRMCCGSDTLLWFALSVFRVADMIGIDGHVSFLPQKKKMISAWRAVSCAGMSTRVMPPCCRVPRRDGSAGEQVRCACCCWPVGCQKGVHQGAEVSEDVRWR